MKLDSLAEKVLKAFKSGHCSEICNILSRQSFGYVYWSARVGLHYRAVAVEVPKVLLWFWIGNHEDYTLQLHNHRGRLVEKSCNAT